MAEPANPGPNKAAERAAREQRLATALRENLRRRKEQARAQRQVGTARPKKNVGGDGDASA
ncbi:MAG: hypothetical protein JO320_11380 [Alphaproteobacteria bacterium]|nr:hypothetical protein [Alphaproteobacteria bacterium]MBV9203465.1 hypothetical protein [Alphaproteobacteria bacterium]MBV9375642.1 hypothetical protein [Alphaproteobacteria bacterium]MBV9815096.1 hypothetical protein [Alphaproteobacteria bacterium]